MKLKLHSAILYAVALALFCFAVASCQGSAGGGGQRVLRSVRIETGHSDGNYDDRKGGGNDIDSTYVGFSFEPFAWVEPAPTRVIVENNDPYPDEPVAGASEVALPETGGPPVASVEEARSDQSEARGSGNAAAPVAPSSSAVNPPVDGEVSRLGLWEMFVLMVFALVAAWIAWIFWPYWGGPLWGLLGRMLQRRKPTTKAKR